jgi:4-hydroxythreonine-4-phosphate dehydrogenase
MSLEKATNDLVNGDIDALVTAPINKDNIQSDQFNFPGHTEYLQERDGAPESLMFLVSDTLRVGVVTGHIPLATVAESISTEKILAKLKLMDASLRNDFWIRKPKIAVLGLNPHASDNGLIGDEEQKVIIPAIEEARNNDLLAFGPYAADGFFANGTYLQFDAVLAMYHDQGLIPFKQIAFESGVNFTAGLNFVRTSPDHGTAYDIAGKNLASEVSFREALFTAIHIVKHRRETAELQENPLLITKLSRDRD